MKKGFIVFVVLAVLLLGGFFLFSGNEDTNSNQQGQDSNPLPPVDELGEGSNDDEPLDWRNVELTDVLTGETFTISQLNDKPILLESFAVWCPTCKKQQDEVKALHEDIGDDVVSIGLDTDVNEDASQVKSHAQSNGFNWRFAVSPASMTQSLINEFGPGIVSAPSAPVVLICPDGSARKLSSGVKKADKLKSEIDAC
jgi:thiol-disulfide isomerase/thioredoxin